MSAKTTDSKALPCESGQCTNINVLERLSTLETTAGEMRNDLRDIKTAIVGNKELKVNGFAQRLEAVEVSDAEQNKKLAAWGGIVTAVGVIITMVKDWLQSK